MKSLNSNIMKKINENKYVKQTKKSFVSLLFSRAGLFVLLILLQIGLATYIYFHLDINMSYIVGGDSISKLIIMMFILNMKKVAPSNKVSWFLLISIVPTFGILAFLLSHYGIGYRREQRKVIELDLESRKYIDDKKQLYDRLRLENESLYTSSTYLDTMGFPIYQNTRSNYFKVGDDMYQSMLADIKKAESFIFMEFFIIDYGYMWGSILEELVKKVKEGVKIKLLIDGTNLITRVSTNFINDMDQLGIDCRVFSPMYPIVSTSLNNRDHRKVMVIDGKIGYTGGINLADEYINVYERFGHWKDCGLRIRGEAVKSLTIMFLNMWNSRSKQINDYSKYLIDYKINDANGYYIPLADNPMDDERLSKNVLLDMIYKANTYIYIMTPYLIVDDEIIKALQFRAKSGVDIRICLPHIPDKKIAFALAKDHYSELIPKGIRIFEYMPGFCHSKTWLVDSKQALVGTINMDYRALSQNFECGIYMYDTESIVEIKEDFDMFFDIGIEIKQEDIKNIKKKDIIVAKLAKPFAPLM